MWEMIAGAGISIISMLVGAGVGMASAKKSE